MLVPLERSWVAVFLESLQVLRAVAVSLGWLSTQGTGTPLPVLAIVAAATNPLQVLWLVLRVVAILVVDIRRIRLPTDFAWSSRLRFPGVVV
jgi:hypothetical protein